MDDIVHGLYISCIQATKQNVVKESKLH